MKAKILPIVSTSGKFLSFTFLSQTLDSKNPLHASVDFVIKWRSDNEGGWWSPTIEDISSKDNIFSYLAKLDKHLQKTVLTKIGYVRPDELIRALDVEYYCRDGQYVIPQHLNKKNLYHVSTENDNLYHIAEITEERAIKLARKHNPELKDRTLTAKFVTVLNYSKEDF